MDDKFFGMLEKMYVEMQNGFKDVITELKVVKNDLKQDIARLEDKIDINHKALYDGYSQNMESISEIKENLEKLTDKVDNQEIKLQVLKSVK